VTEHSYTLSPIGDPEDWDHALLCEAFPEKERKPFPDIPALMAAHRAIYGPSRSDVKIPLPPGELPETPYWMK
jgi:hypothetical protein